MEKPATRGVPRVGTKFDHLGALNTMRCRARPGAGHDGYSSTQAFFQIQRELCGAPLDPLPAIGAKLKFRVNGPAAPEAFSTGHFFRCNPGRFPMFIEDSAAAGTFEERRSLLDRKEGNKEETHVVVQPHEPGRG